MRRATRFVADRPIDPGGDADRMLPILDEYAPVVHA